MYKIRKKVLNDCEATSYVVTKAWNETYKGIVNDKFLKELLDKLIETKQREIDNFNDFKEKYVLEVDNKVVGFITFGPARLKEYSSYGEVYAFYILQEYQGQGHGRKMLEKAFSILESEGYKKNNHRLFRKK